MNTQANITKHVPLYDSTDPANPILVNAEVLLIRDSDGLYKTYFPNLPKYKTDGRTPIVYTTSPREVEEGRLVGYTSTNSGPSTEANGDILITLTQTPRLRNITITKEYNGTGTHPDVVSNVRLGGVNYFAEDAPINTPSMSHRYTGLAYFEIDGTTERRFTLYSFEPEGYILDVSYFATEQVPGVRRFTGMNFVLKLKKGRADIVLALLFWVVIQFG